MKYILDTIGRNFVRQVNTIIQKVFIRKVSLRFYAKSKFCVCFEVHIPEMQVQPILNAIFSKFCPGKGLLIISKNFLGDCPGVLHLTLGID